jgi:hypothetical protein
MKRHLMLGTVFSAALAVGAAAQSQPPSQSPPSQPPTSQSPTSQSPTSQDTSRSSGTITVTGCLKADTSSPSAAPGAAGAPASSASAGYILEASGSSSASTSPTEKPSPTATSGSSSSTTYKLSGGSSDLASLVGKKVEVKGTVQNRAGSAAGGGAESRPGSSDMGKQQQLRVSSVKEVSGSCSQ